MQQWMNFVVFVDLSLYSAHEIICDYIQTQWVINLWWYVIMNFLKKLINSQDNNIGSLFLYQRITFIPYLHLRRCTVAEEVNQPMYFSISIITSSIEISRLVSVLLYTNKRPLSSLWIFYWKEKYAKSCILATVRNSFFTLNLWIILLQGHFWGKMSFWSRKLTFNIKKIIRFSWLFVICHARWNILYEIFRHCMLFLKW